MASKFDATYTPEYLENVHQHLVAEYFTKTSDDMPELYDPTSNDDSDSKHDHDDMPQLSDPTSTDDSDSKHDHDTCVKMADLAVSTGDYPPIPTELDEATAKFNSQAEQLLATLSRMDLTIHKFMPDRSIYVKFKLDEVEARLAFASAS
jgi:hypothetical protein